MDVWGTWYLHPSAGSGSRNDSGASKMDVREERTVSGNRKTGVAVIVWKKIIVESAAEDML